MGNSDHSVIQIARPGAGAGNGQIMHEILHKEDKLIWSACHELGFFNSCASDCPSDWLTECPSCGPQSNKQRQQSTKPTHTHTKRTHKLSRKTYIQLGSERSQKQNPESRTENGEPRELSGQNLEARRDPKTGSGNRHGDGDGESWTRMNSHKSAVSQRVKYLWAS